MIVMVSGGMDVLHVGHVRLLKAAATYGSVIVALNSDWWLMQKKGYVVMSWHERREVLMSCRYVQGVVPVEDADGTVCEALRRILPRLFLNGGDRTTAHPKEHATCKSLSIGEVFGVGGSKVESSSDLIRRAICSLPGLPTGSHSSAAVVTTGPGTVITGPGS